MLARRSSTLPTSNARTIFFLMIQQKKWYVAGLQSEKFKFLKSTKSTCTQALNSRFDYAVGACCTRSILGIWKNIVKQIHWHSLYQRIPWTVKNLSDLIPTIKGLLSCNPYLFIFSYFENVRWGKSDQIFCMNRVFSIYSYAITNILLIAW